MDLKVTQENLNNALNNVARVAIGRTTLPILNNILIKTENNQLKISATNLDIAISQKIGTKITKNGSLTIPAKLFQEFINNLPKTVISLKQQDNKLQISTDNYTSTINGSPIEDYPVMPEIKKGKPFVLKTKLFKKALQQVIFAASSDESRPILTGVFINTRQGKLYIASTDSYRLAEKQVCPIKEEVSLLIPSNALQDLLRIIGDQDADLQIFFDEQQVRFIVDDIELITRLIDGNYPDYNKLIPTQFSNTATVNKQELTTIAKISGLFSRENAGSITVMTNEAEGELSVKSIASQVGENHSKTQGKIKGSGEITLNSRYLIEGLQAIEAEEVDFCFNGKLDPIVLKSPNNKDYQHIIMPLKS
jgi:DNA polymerase-3 subunit beta